MTGWDIPDITQCLMSEPMGEISGMEDFLKTYPLAALSSDKKHMAVIRDFSFHETKGKITMTNAKGSKEGAHTGMTLITAYSDGGNIHNVILPNNLTYSKVHLVGNEIHIYHGSEKTITNFQEVRKLWSFYKLSEPEILETFLSLKNEFIGKSESQTQSDKTINAEHFGILAFDDKTDRYWCEVQGPGGVVKLSFSNTDKTQFDKNIFTANGLLSMTTVVQNSMMKEMLPLKNMAWLNEHQNELDENDFSNELKLYALHVYENGSADFYFKAGNLFWGHEILTSVDAAGKYRNSAVAG